MKKYGLIAFIVLSMLPVRLFAYAIDVFGNGSENKYRFYPTDGNLYQAYVNIPDFQGLQGYSFWIGNANGGWDWEDGRSDDLPLSGTGLPQTCDGRFVVTIDITSGATNYGPRFEPEVSIALSDNYIEADDSGLTLYAVVGMTDAVSYEWQSSTDADTWSVVGTSSEPQFTITALPQEKTYYRVVVSSPSSGNITSQNTAMAEIAFSCSGESPVTVFKEDFGTTTTWNLTDGYRSRTDIEGMQGYDYRRYPYKISDGQYALVADPYWCGCGSGDGAELEKPVTECTPDERSSDETYAGTTWYRGFQYPASRGVKLRDHTLNEQNDNAGKYGMCLMINYREGGETLAFEHQLTEEEKTKMVPGSTVHLSAFVASVAKEFSGRVVSMTLSMQFRAEGSSQWEDLFTPREQIIHHHDNWFPITEDFELGSGEGDYRYRIYSSGQSGIGNDVMIDDIKLEVRYPTLDIFFEEEDGTLSDSETLADGEDSFNLVIPEFNPVVLGEDPFVLLFVFDEAAGKYYYAGDLDHDVDGGQYEVTVSKEYFDKNGELKQFFDTLPDEVKLVGVGVNKEQDKNVIIDGIESGSINPATGEQNCYRTDGYVTLRVECPHAPLISVVGGNTVSSAQGTVEYPVLELSYNRFAGVLKYTVVQNGIEIPAASGTITDEAQLQSGIFQIDLSAFSASLAWMPGNSYEIAIAVDEDLSAIGMVNNCDLMSNTLTFAVEEGKIWPTIITPYDVDGKNDDFLMDMPGIHLEIFDRWGNVVHSGQGGWPQPEASKQQPGVYYYIATLPDGSVKNGTVELYR